MISKLHVSNLPDHTTAAELRTIFAAHGKVCSVSLIQDVGTKRSLGTARILMEGAEAAHECVKALDGHLINGRPMRIEGETQRIVHSPSARNGGRGGTTGSVFAGRQHALDELNRLFSNTRSATSYPATAP